MMHCNGKCYLSKKLKEQEKQDQQEPVSRNDKFEIVPYFVPQQISLTATTCTVKKEFIIKNENAVSALRHSIFHPPSA